MSPKPVEKGATEGFLKELPPLALAQAREIISRLSKLGEGALPARKKEQIKGQMEDELKNLYKQNNIPYPL